MKNLLMLLALIVGFLAVGCGSEGRNENEADTENEGTDDTEMDTGTAGDECTQIVKSIAAGEATPSTVGCEFYAVNLDTLHYDGGTVRAPDTGIGVGNLDKFFTAKVTIWQATTGGNWVPFRTREVDPLESVRMDLPDDFHLTSPGFNLEGSGLNERGAFKITSTIPIVALQGNPLSGVSDASTDASTLIPTSSLDYIYEAFGVGGAPISVSQKSPKADVTRAYIAVVATKPDTTVTVTPAVPLKIEGGIPDPKYSVDTDPDSDSEPDTDTGPYRFDMEMQEGDVLYLHNKLAGDSIAGTIVQSDEDHPIAVFTGHECTNLPENVRWCDHLEEQLPGLRFWGSHFIASRFPAREMNHALSDPVYWQVIAAEDNTKVTFNAPEGVIFGHTATFDEENPEAPTGGLINSVALESVVLAKHEMIEFMTQADWGSFEDFEITAEPDVVEIDPETQQPRETKPIGVMQYMTGSEWTKDIGNIYGDPAMAYVPPVEQFLPLHNILVPGNWYQTTFIVTRKKGIGVLFEGELLNDSLFHEVQNSGYEVARISKGDFVGMSTFTFESVNENVGIGVLVLAIDRQDSYAFFGGMGLDAIYTPPL